MCVRFACNNYVSKSLITMNVDRFFHTNKNILSFWTEITNNFIISESIFNRCWKYQLQQSSYHLWRQSKKLYFFQKNKYTPVSFYSWWRANITWKVFNIKKYLYRKQLRCLYSVRFGTCYRNTNTGDYWMAKTNVLIGYLLLYNLKIKDNIYWLFLVIIVSDVRVPNGIFLYIKWNKFLSSNDQFIRLHAITWNTKLVLKCLKLTLM